MRALLAVGLFLLLLLLPASASAATVSFREAPYRFTTIGTLLIEDGADEANDLTAAFVDGVFTVRDERAPATAGVGCAAVGERAVRCDPRGVLNLEIVVRAGAGDDRVDLTRTSGASVDGGAGDDTLVGSQRGYPINVLDGGPGQDRLEGGGSLDLLTGGGERDELLGGAGNDVLAGDGSGGGARADDILDGGSGDDAVEYPERTDPVEVRLGAPGVGGAPGERDELISIESAAGGSGSDRLVGDASANYLSGCADACASATGDHLEGGGGPDVLSGSVADDLLVGGADADLIGGSEGADRLFGGPGRDDLTGGVGDDLLADGSGEDRLDGGEGADRFDLDPGAGDAAGTFDRVLCGEGADRVTGANGDDLLLRDCEQVRRRGSRLRVEVLPYESGLIVGIRWPGRRSCRGTARLLSGPSGDGRPLARRRLRRRAGRPAATLVPPRAVGDARVRIERLACGRARPRAVTFGVFF